MGFAAVGPFRAAHHANFGSENGSRIPEKIESMTPTEKEQICTKLDASRKAVMQSLAGLREEQWRFVPATGGWSIAQIVDHLTYIESQVTGKLMSLVQNEPPDPLLPAITDRKELALMRGVPNRTRKAVMPPEFASPQGTAEIAHLVEQFQAVRERTIGFARDCTVDLREYGNEHFVFKMLNGEQWLLLNALHAERHVGQIDEIKQAPDFPHLTAAD